VQAPFIPEHGVSHHPVKKKTSKKNKVESFRQRSDSL